MPLVIVGGDVIRRLRDAGCVFADDEARILLRAAVTPDELELMISRRVTGVPLEYVVGWADFCGVRVGVNEGVFVPRARSETLVDEAARLLGDVRRPPVVLDLCCGTGALGLAVAVKVGDVELHASDIDAAAVSCAKRNVEPIGGRVHKGDLYGPLPSDMRGHVDIIVANVPYVPTSDIALLPAEARDHEPRSALDGGDDGLDLARRVVAEAPQWLAPGGHLLLEISDRQVAAATAMIRDSGLTCDDRCLSGTPLGDALVVSGSCHDGSPIAE